jgi:CubicO group peptidase (beta-lactamase class C family)
MINETDYTKNPLTKEQEMQIDALFTQYDKADTPGCAVGVIKNGRFIYKKSFGMANLDYDIPITADSKFDIGSVAKQFTAACIVLLVLEEKLKLNDDIRKYIPEMNDFGNVITIDHLLHHTSGLKDYTSLLFFSLSAQFSEFYFDNKDSLNLLFKQKDLNFKPGEMHSYSNSGYLLLGEIISRVSGISFAEYVTEKIFKPLGMHNSLIDENSRKVQKNRVASYYKMDEHDYYRLLCTSDDLGAKGVVTTINDLLLWDQNFYTGKVGGDQMIEMLTTKGLLNNGDSINYCLGLEVNNYNHLPTIGHDGGYLGFTASMTRFPEQNTSIICLCNCADNISGLAYNVADIVLSSIFSRFIQPETLIEANTQSETLNLKEDELKCFCGSFWSEEKKLQRKIYLKDGNLFYWRSEGSESKLAPISKNELAIIGSTHLVLRYELNNDCKKFSFFENNILKMTLNSYEPIDFNAEYLTNYVGNYFCEEMDVVYKLEIVSDKLILFLKGKQISVIEAVMPNLFKVLDWDCIFEFIYNDQQVIVGFKLDSDRIKNIKFVKQS